mgnify:CR=1 FL=1
MIVQNWCRVSERVAQVLDGDNGSRPAYENRYLITVQQVARVLKILVRGGLRYSKNERSLRNRDSHNAWVIEQFERGAFRLGRSSSARVLIGAKSCGV